LGARGRRFGSAHPDYVKLVLATIALAIALAPSASADVPKFRGAIAPIDAALAKRMTGVSWRSGCPVALRDLRLLTLSHRDFDGGTRPGRLVVHRDVARDVVRVFRELYAARFPIRRMWLIDAFGGSDFRSIERLHFTRPRWRSVREEPRA
jgi:hypothetical protein